jgi:hypothetical protein
MCAVCRVRNLWFSLCSLFHMGRNSVVGVPTRYGLDRPGSDSGVSEIFRTRSDRPWGPPSTKGIGSLYRGVNRASRGVDHSPPSGAEVKERVG